MSTTSKQSGRVTNHMKTARKAINNPGQMGINQEQVEVLEKKLKGMKRRWIEECELASKVDPRVPCPQEARGAVGSESTGGSRTIRRRG